MFASTTQVGLIQVLDRLNRTQQKSSKVALRATRVHRHIVLLLRPPMQGKSPSGLNLLPAPCGSLALQVVCV